MFSPFIIPSHALDLTEIHRQKSSRPASRAEILARYQRDYRDNAIRLMAEQSPSARASSTGHPRTARMSLQPLDRVRQTISRALMTAAERIEPNAA